MGKYDTKTQYDYPITDPTQVQSYFLLSIANELAESNRLKRYELKLSGTRFKEKELEDQA